MYKFSATILVLVNVVVCANAFFSTQPYLHYGSRMPYRRRYRQPQQKYYRKPQPYQRYRQQPDEKMGYRYPQQQYFRNSQRQQPVKKKTNEVIKDLQRKIELYVPCSPYCRYYEARIKPSQPVRHSQNRQTIHVSGPGYEKSWDIPRNVNVNGITKSIVHSQYLKLDFPKLILSKSDDFDYHSFDENAKQNHHSQHQQYRNRQNRHINYHADYYAEKNNEYARISKYGQGDDVGPEEQQHSNENIDPYFYATSDGIEVIDVDANDMENNLYEKETKQVSIGFWDSRGKFRYY